MISGISFSGANNVINKNDATGTAKNNQPKKPCIMHNYTLTVPSYMDNEIETYCANKGIKFTKSTNMEAVKNKIAKPEAPFIKAEIDVEKFNELLQSQTATNVYHLGRNFDQSMKNKFDSILSDDEIPATTLSIKTPRYALNYTVDKTIDTLKSKGIEGLNYDQLVISFVKQGEYDQYTYFAFSEAGMDKIPVYMDQETYKIAQAAGIAE